MKKTISLLLVFLISIGFVSAQSNWSEEMYVDFTYELFSEYTPAAEFIDFENIDYALLQAAIFYETNKQRVENNRERFIHSPSLEEAAAGHSRDMVDYNFYSHTSTVSGKRTMSNRLTLVGISNCSMAENIHNTFGIQYQGGRSVYSPDQNGGYFSYTYQGDPIPPHTYLSFAEAAVEGWMNSQGHRRNILNSDYVYLGTGAGHYRDDGFYDMNKFKLTQNFSSYSPD